jgi:rRNA pseudouridine-1189 N-methylase Emg1 (Nep1/Mra1 family)
MQWIYYRDLFKKQKEKTPIDFPLKESQKFRNLEIQKDRQNVKSRFRIVHLILSTLMTGPAAALPFHVFLHLTSRAGKTAQ